MAERYVLSITLPNPEIWDAYYYGNAKDVQIAHIPDGSGRVAFLADYGDNAFLADYQNDRFLSGLYFGSVIAEEVR